MSSLLVTGGAGFIGANFVRYWLERHPDDRIIVLDSMSYAAHAASLTGCADNSKFVFYKGSIGDPDLVDEIFASEGIGSVVHFAAESHVDRSISGPDPFIETNIVGTHCLLKAALKAWSGRDFKDCRFHHISTDEVYGSLKKDDPGFTEMTRYAPNSTYSASKAASDHLVRAYNKTYGLPVTTTNCSNNYGPLQFPEKLIPLAITNLLGGKSVPVYGDGLNIRDWLYVGDHCEGIEQVLKRGRVGHTYNIGGDSERTNIDLVNQLCALVDKCFAEDDSVSEKYPDAPPANGGNCAELITYVTDRKGHDRRYAIDATKARQELGFRPRHDFEDGLAATVRWYLDNDYWWRPILDGSYLKDRQPGSSAA